MPSVRTKSVASELGCFLSTSLSHALKSVGVSVNGVPTRERVLKCARADLADYQWNAPVSVFRALRADRSQSLPKHISTQQLLANAVRDSFLSSSSERSIVSDVQVVGPGFLNLRLNDAYVCERLSSWSRTGTLPALEVTTAMRVAVDFSSPNIAKEMHVGHLRSTIIGDSICRILEYCGHDVSRINHVGDWGTPFGMLIEHLSDRFPHYLSQPLSISELHSAYVGGKMRFDDEEAFRTRARARVVRLQSGDEESIAAWRVICQTSRTGFQDIYSRLGVRLEEKGESFYCDLLAPLVEELVLAGVAVDHDGAKCVFIPGESFPLILQKSDGGFTYDTTDMAAIRHRVQEGHDWLIYVTDAGQRKHFELVWAAAQRCGFLNRPSADGVANSTSLGLPPVARLDHVGFGVVLDEKGKKFRSRSGDAVRLIDLLEEAKERTLALLRSRSSGDSLSATSEQQLALLAEQIGYAALKYADLSKNCTGDYSFSYDRMLDLRGNTAVYLLYAYARICGVLSKAHETVLKDSSRLIDAPITLCHPAERALATECVRYHDVVQEVATSLRPHLLCDYAYGLSEKLNGFYRDCRVLGDPKQNSRLALLHSTALVLGQSLRLLGIQPLERI